MRVAAVTESPRELASDRVGARVTATARGLQADDHEVDLITPRWWGPRRAVTHARHVTHHRGGERRLTPWRAARAIISSNPDVVHLIDVRPTVVLAAAVAARTRRARLVYELATMDSPLAGDGRLADLACARLDRVIAPSKTVHTALRAADRDPPAAIIPDPIEVAEIGRVVPDGRIDVAWVGADHDPAEVENALSALAEVRDAPWTAALLGPFAPDVDIVEAVTQFDLTTRVRLARRPTRRERLAAYRGASTFVQTAPVCAYPTELLWALASGCVGVVQYRERSAAHELIERHGRGHLVSSPEEVADALAETITADEPEFDGRFAEYDRSTYTDRLLESYEAALT